LEFVKRPFRAKRDIQFQCAFFRFLYAAASKAENAGHDWSQDEIADFYRAHRLLVENGAGIGIDRGVSDIGEPWMVFFDGTSQDVFLHVARIDNRCHLICDSLDLRLSASNINQLITEFENSVRELLSIRAERSKNVIIHPAARIIMSISAIFLLFKLETGEAQAKELQEKGQGGLEAGSGRWSDKVSASMARAQTAFGRVFESTDAPGHVALMAGAIIALELSRSIVQSSDDKPNEIKADVYVEHNMATAPVFEVHSHLVVKAETADSQDNNTYIAPRPAHLENAPADLTFTLDAYVTNPEQKLLRISEVGKTAAAVTNAEEHALAVKASESAALVEPLGHEQTASEQTKTTTGKAVAVALDNEATKALKEFIVFANGEDVPLTIDNISNIKIATKDDVKEISASNLDLIDDKVGFFIQTQYDDAKLYKLVQYFANIMNQYDYDYVSGRVLIEEKNVENLADQDIGLWTNVMIDGSTFSVVGHAGLIDDVVTFFA
jgi:hypothetical protein